MLASDKGWTDWVIESIQEIVSKMNEAKRGSFHILNIHTDNQEH